MTEARSAKSAVQAADFVIVLVSGTRCVVPSKYLRTAEITLSHQAGPVYI
jgi:hypothetical protein